MDTKKVRAAILIVIAAAIWGLLVIPIKKVPSYDPLWVTWIRQLSTAAILFALNWQVVVALGRPKKMEVFVGVLFGASLVLWTLAVPKTTAANATVLGNVGPFVALMVEVAFYRYRAKVREALLLLVMLLGLVTLVGGLAIPKAGDILTLGSGIAWGLAIPLGQRLPKGGFTRSLIWGQLLGVALLPAWSGLAGESFLPPLPANGEGLWLIFMVLVGAGGYVIYTPITSRNVISSHLNSALCMNQAVVSTIVGAAFLHEPLTLRGAVGAVLILGSAAILVLTQNGRKGGEAK